MAKFNHHKLWLAAVMTAAGTIGISTSASAGTISYNNGAVVTSAFCGTSNINSQPEVEVLVESASCSGGVQLTQYYKVDYDGGAESGGFAGAYGAFGWAGDPNSVEIRFTGGTAISCPDCFLAVKDGNANPAMYAFDISNWDGTSSIFLTGFWEGTRGSISNVSIWGKVDDSNPPVTVPEPAGLALVGMALAAAGLARRRAQRA